MAMSFSAKLEAQAAADTPEERQGGALIDLLAMAQRQQSFFASPRARVQGDRLEVQLADAAIDLPGPADRMRSFFAKPWVSAVVDIRAEILVSRTLLY
jgi:hypothetical protein